MRRPWVWVLCVVAAQSLASSSVTVREGSGALWLTAGQHAFSAQLGEGGLTGKQVTLRSTPARLEGTLAARRVELRFSPGRIDGELAGERVSVEVKQRGIGFELSGTLADRPVQLRVSASRVLGEVGRCEYALLAGGAIYEGWRSCLGDGGVPIATTLELPEGLRHRSDTEAGALLLIALVHQPATLPEGPPGETIRNSP